jgi:hypothetical protein
MELNFWIENKLGDGSYDIHIDQLMLINFLKWHGYYKYYSSSNKYISVEKNIVTEVTGEQIKDFVLDYVRDANKNLSEKVSNERIERELINRSASLLSNNFFSHLHVAKLKFIQDEKNKSYFPFNNCIVEVSSDGIRELDYTENDFCIWKNQVINKKFSITKQKSDFDKFISNICRNDESRINSLKSAIGYLLCNYKDPTRTKAIVFYDETDSKVKALEGRTGKSLVAKAISQLRDTLIIDGKNFNMKDKFIFQQVNLSTQVINLNDVLSNFNFESFFSIVTEGIKIEKKNRNSFTIPYEKSPKLLISTNHTLLGKGGSFSDRMFEIEFSSFYSKAHKPIDDFGKSFFHDWGEDEWNAFYCFMFECLVYYFKYGLVHYASINVKQRKMKQELGVDFVEFANSIEVNQEFDKHELFEKFKADSQNFIGYSQRTFTENLRNYAHYKDMQIIERKSANKNFVKLVTSD